MPFESQYVFLVKIHYNPLKNSSLVKVIIQQFSSPVSKMAMSKGCICHASLITMGAAGKVCVHLDTTHCPQFGDTTTFASIPQHNPNLWLGGTCPMLVGLGQCLSTPLWHWTYGWVVLAWILFRIVPRHIYLTNVYVFKTFGESIMPHRKSYIGINHVQLKELFNHWLPFHLRTGNEWSPFGPY